MEIELEITSSGNDGGSNIHTNTFETNDTYLFVGDYSKHGGLDHCFLLFENVAIDQGAIIGRANLVLGEYGSSFSSPWSFNIHAEDVDSGTVPTDNASLIAKARTTAFVTIAGTQENLRDNVVLADLKDVIAEIVARPGWTSGNDILILCIANVGGDGYALFASYDHATKLAPRLFIKEVVPDVDISLASPTTGADISLSAGVPSFVATPMVHMMAQSGGLM